jgi:hypothetical protein
MAELPGPFEIFELEDGQTVALKIDRTEVGEALIHPAYKPEGKWIKVLRVWVQDGTKEFFPPYWDVTSQTLVAQLEPLLKVGDVRNREFHVTKHGVAPKARFSVEVR